MDRLQAQIRRLHEQGVPFVQVTVVRRIRPSSATVGDKAIVTADGEIEGFVGGHCTRELVIQQAQACLRTGTSKLLLVTSMPPANSLEGVTVLPMTCASEGEVELFLEPQQVDPLLVVVGASPIAVALAELAPRFGFVARRLALESEAPNGTEEVKARLSRQLGVDIAGPIYGVVATMGLYDTDGLLTFAERPLNYLGVVVSPRRWTALRSELTEAGAHADWLDFVTGPAGLDIGALGPDEIALSVLAQVVERRRRPSERQWGPTQHVDAAVATESTPPLTDPVCGMSVDIAKTPHQFTWGGVTYGFCCAGCRDKFARDPDVYAPSRVI